MKSSAYHFKFVLFVSLVIFNTSLNASARLGETAIQCADRYGNPKIDPATKSQEKYTPMIERGIQHTYEYHGWRISAAFLDLNGPAVRVEYKKMSGPDVKPAIQDYELAAILKAEMPDGMTWKQTLFENPSSLNHGVVKIIEGLVFNAAGANEWRRSDGAIAQLILFGMVIRLDLPAVRQYEQQIKVQKEQKARESVPQF